MMNPRWIRRQTIGLAAATGAISFDATPAG
jgi:hypothetical protein